MGEAKKPCNKYCMVPMCKNSIKNTPDKVFFHVPLGAKVRKQWCKMMKRDDVSPISSLYCCEDHFNVKEDTANYIQYSIMKDREKCSLRLKKGVVPHIFLCEERNMPPPVDSLGVVKRQRLTLVHEALAEFAFKSSKVSEIVESPQKSNKESNPNTSYTNVCDFNLVGTSTSHNHEVCDDHQAEICTSDIEDKLQSDKTVQVNIKPKYRSKGVNVNVQTEKKNLALSPFPFLSHNIGSTPIKLSVLKRNFFTEILADSISITDHTKSEVEASYAQRLNPHLSVAITTNPRIDLTEIESTTIKDQLQRAIFKAVKIQLATPSQPPFAPEFRGRAFLQDGEVKLRCADNETLAWLKGVVPTMKAPREGFCLTLIEQQQIRPKVNAALYVPDYQGDADFLLKLLTSQNYRYYAISSWQLTNYVLIAGDCPGMLLYLRIPSEEIPKILKEGCRVAYSHGSIHIRFFTPDGLSDVLPEKEPQAAPANRPTDRPNENHPCTDGLTDGQTNGSSD